MNLHKVKGSPPKGKRLYSGPAAISIITGCRYEKAMEVLKSHSETTGTGISPWLMFNALASLGWRMRPVKIESTIQETVLARLDDCRDPKLPSLARWFKLRGNLTNCLLLVKLSGHWLVVKGRKAADNYHPESVFIRDINFRRSTVVAVWTLEHVAKVETNPEIIRRTAEIRKQRKENLEIARAIRAIKRQEKQAG